MTHQLIRTPGFIRSIKRIVKSKPASASEIAATLRLLADDPHSPRLKTHKLRGDLEGRWACSVAYDLRLIFRFVERDESPAILLLAVGTHEEVY